MKELMAYVEDNFKWRVNEYEEFNLLYDSRGIEISKIRSSDCRDQSSPDML